MSGEVVPGIVQGSVAVHHGRISRFRHTNNTDGEASASVDGTTVGVTTVLIGLLGLDEDESFYRNTLKKLARPTRS